MVLRVQQLDVWQFANIFRVNLDLRFHSLEVWRNEHKVKTLFECEIPFFDRDDSW